MKKNYLLKFTFLFLFTFGISKASAQTVVITAVVDGTLKNAGCNAGSGFSDPRFVELYVDGTIDFTGYDLGQSSNGSASYVKKSLDGLGTISDQFVYIVTNGDEVTFNEAFPGKTVLSVAFTTINGDESFRITDNTNTVLDAFGIPADVGTAAHDTWNYEDSYAKRKDFVLPNAGTFVSSNWTYGGANALDGATCATLASAVSLGSYAVKTTTWLGTNTNWNDPANWDNGVPTLGYNAVVPDLATDPEITTSIAATTGDLTISDLDGLSVLSGSLTISGDLTINTGSSLYLESRITASKTIDAASVILNGNYSAADANSFFYFTETFIDNTSGWSLISSPTVGEKIDGNSGDGNFAFFNKLQKSMVNLNYGIAFYDNSQADPMLRWDYYSIAEIEVPTPTEDMLSGKGYTVLPESDPAINADGEKGFLGFKGAIATDFVEIGITDNSPPGGTGNAFNLIGNPYPSFIPANNAADATNAFLNVNAAELAEQTFYVWDKTTSSYIIKNQMNARYIAPGQAFFVKSKAGGGTVKFTEAMQSHQASGTFNKSNNTEQKIILKVKNKGKEKTTDIYYVKGKTTGFDNGYDSSIFGGFDTSFSLYTDLVSGNDKKQLGIQTLPNSNYENMIIPVGLKATKDSKITFSAKSLNLPTGYMVFLEDKLTNAYTRLDAANSEYSVTIDNDVVDNRFFIHTTTSSVLNTNNNKDLNNISIFKASNSNLKITGLSALKSNVSLFNVLGKQVFTSTFDGNLNNTIALPNLAKGVYIVKLKTANSTNTKKIIID
ncbi:T9SS type A sorting domain-containing protein [Polaribacter batillariae]|uniref:T9SS type A sorting domain-containing protein n=1 Tax=Polaribacter batillariae TaxID=2808900 RepID=A0ABX7SRT9_9FLAO|nr:T9SS type A sorting domain-containing protein [Polaribacter batillariae]QTD36947.1 T9SS type A sorting domain-containing protein [Polaribacter batillariae]